jgi:quinol monooxygenase YgiN
MRVYFRLAFALCIAAVLPAHPAQAQSSAIYVATYVEVMPNAVAPGIALIAQYREAAAKEDGNLRADALQEIGRPNRFVIVEVWRDKVALDAHGQGAAAAKFHGELGPIADAPYDERINNGLYVVQASSERRSGAIYVVTHVDVIPPGKEDCMTALKAMSLDSAGDAGYIGYDVLQQANRGNHFTVVEVWSGREALDNHAMAAHTRAFRDKLRPIAGALYDERYYQALK